MVWSGRANPWDTRVRGGAPVCACDGARCWCSMVWWPCPRLDDASEVVVSVCAGARRALATVRAAEGHT